ncbi:AhpC/TSA family protein [Dysgonomonas sp. Marseille-P4677]|uniref:TlpA disulfide reductase family protein n=1 Tax=Dysgonomonas sp. Marseille-P4677 TaxID=2364790 RepID=UPI001913F8FD|nr:TlpA disulfide reductase family protein [Dysgonomonas sp. Marseille-P4677]MBK5720397.1 AhpC/TSA family protein [Dysgonomonas sp. Marseille-P4677]
MKKIILFLSVVAMLVTSCVEKEAFTIKGTLPNTEYDGKQVYLKVLGENWKDLIAIDTVTVTNGSFEFKGLAKGGSIIHFIELAEPTDKVKRPVLLVVEPGQIEVSMDSISTVKGTASNDSYQAFNDKLGAIDSEMKALYKKAQEDTTKTLRAELEKQFEEKDAQKAAANFDFVKANAQNQLGAYFFSSRSYMFSLDQMKEISALIKPEYKTNERMKKVEARIQALDATSEGKVFTDLKGKTPEGADASLADYAGKGNYVLVDFWASWCPPCRAEMPKLVEAYKLNKGKGFEIVGISLDKNNEDWVKGIKNLGITWPQISDLKFWDSELAAAYGINSIPHLVLLDKDGKIMARGLSADQAVAKLNELLK